VAPSDPRSTQRTRSTTAAGLCYLAVIAALLLAAHFDVPVCPHAGGVGLCEHVQHFSVFDYIAVSGSLENRIIEYADHLHEHFVTPVEMQDGRYRLPRTPGLGVEMLPESLERFAFPNGPIWRERATR
jgi:L-fuconate dehydratase